MSHIYTVWGKLQNTICFFSKLQAFILPKQVERGLCYLVGPQAPSSGVAGTPSGKDGTLHTGVAEGGLNTGTMYTRVGRVLDTQENSAVPWGWGTCCPLSSWVSRVNAQDKGCRDSGHLREDSLITQDKRFMVMETEQLFLIAVK